MSLEFTYQSQGLLQALRHSPQALNKYMSLAVLRSVQEMARSARGYAPKAESTLTQSINHRMVSPLEGEVAAGVNYARMVEEGTGPGGTPGWAALVDWINVKGITPRDPSMDQADLTFLIIQKIHKTGTPAQPFMQPAYDINQGRAEQRMDRAIEQAIREISA